MRGVGGVVRSHNPTIEPSVNAVLSELLVKIHVLRGTNPLLQKGRRPPSKIIQIVACFWTNFNFLLPDCGR